MAGQLCKERGVHETGKKLLNLMFRPGETICVSPNKYGYHSVLLEDVLTGKVTLAPPDGNKSIQYCKSDELIMIALNPIKGFRKDENVFAYRNFLLELDVGTIDNQVEYIKRLGIPYSSMVFSGSKSVHTIISLDQDLPSESVYRKFSEWMLNVANHCDQNIKNPSRSTRIPGAYREPGKQQVMLEFKGPVRLTDLVNWMKNYPDAMPRKEEKRQISKNPNFNSINSWAIKKLVDGPNLLKNNRNSTWFSLAVEFTLAGYSEEDIVSILEEYFVEERDFKRKEWKSAICSGIKYATTKYD